SINPSGAVATFKPVDHTARPQAARPRLAVACGRTPENAVHRDALRAPAGFDIARRRKNAKRLFAAVAPDTSGIRLLCAIPPSACGIFRRLPLRGRVWPSR